MIKTFDIDITNSKALALFNYIKTLDFIYIKEDNDTLTTKQKKAIDKGLQSLDNGEKVSHNDVMEQMKKKYPKYFE